MILQPIPLFNSNLGIMKHIHINTLFIALWAALCLPAACMEQRSPNKKLQQLNTLGQKKLSNKNAKKLVLSDEETLELKAELKDTCFIPHKPAYPLSPESSQNTRLFVCPEKGCHTQKGSLYIADTENPSCDRAKARFKDSILSELQSRATSAAFNDTGDLLAYLTNRFANKSTSDAYIALRNGSKDWRRTHSIELDTVPTSAKIAFLDDKTIAVALLSTRNYVTIYSLNGKGSKLFEKGLDEGAQISLLSPISAHALWVPSSNGTLSVYSKKDIADQKSWDFSATHKTVPSKTESALTTPHTIDTILDLNANGTVLGKTTIIHGAEQKKSDAALFWLPAKPTPNVGKAIPTDTIIGASLSREGNRAAITYRTDEKPEHIQVAIMDTDGDKALHVGSMKSKSSITPLWGANASRIFLQKNNAIVGVIKHPYAAFGLNNTAIKQSNNNNSKETADKLD